MSAVLKSYDNNSIKSAITFLIGCVDSAEDSLQLELKCPHEVCSCAGLSKSDRDLHNHRSVSRLRS